MERLQKIIARAGLASRREAERWIEEGRITVNGTVITKLGSQADPFNDSIKVDGKRIKSAAAPLYYAFHKPPGVITTLNDPQHRPDITPYIARLGEKRRVFPVGRLDYNTTGLLLLTNDGALALRLSHPRFGVTKVYRVKLSSCPTPEDFARLREGIRLEDGMTAPARARVIEKLKTNAWVEIEVHEGRKREVRRMFEALGYFVEKLVRIRVGPVELGHLPPGELRPLTQSEVKSLQITVGLAKERPVAARHGIFAPPKKSGGHDNRRSKRFPRNSRSSDASYRTPRSR
ncbi:MAG TPA: pseudouridine synthase [Candidatus Limnocylindrales bacterium]|nr:pseudouridine synthase [Candidatus Limnocylindrales bacterium]